MGNGKIIRIPIMIKNICAYCLVGEIVFSD
jgi:hypothetical protein